MTLQEKIRAEATIRAIAQEEGIQPQEVRQAMQEALDEAWAARRTPGNLRAQLAWQRLFPAGRKPSVEEFLVRLSRASKSMPGEQN